MYNTNKKQYIFKQSSGKVWNFFHDEKTGLYYSTLTRRNTWTEPVVIQKDVQSSFFADMDYDDCFHILYQDKTGNIFYSKIDNTNIQTIPVLNSKQPSPYDKFFYLIPSKNLTHAFFIIHHNDSCILAHQTITGETASKPRVIDYVPRNDLPYTITYDKSGNIYAFYQSSDGKFMQTGYKKYVQAQNFWGEFTPVTKFDGDTEYARAIIDGKNVLHLCYQRRTTKQYELVYQQKVPDKNLWSGESVIQGSGYPFGDSSLLWANDALYIFWVRNETVYFSASSDGGASWSKAMKYNLPAGKQLMCMTYKTNNPAETDRLFAREIPGCFINGFKLAFYEDTTSNINSLSPDELRNMIVESLKMLKAGMEELKEANAAIRENISNIESTQQNLEREFTKYSLKLGLIENEITQIKGTGRQLESLKSALNDLKSNFDKNMEEINRFKGYKLSRNPTNTRLTKKIEEQSV